MSSLPEDVSEADSAPAVDRLVQRLWGRRPPTVEGVVQPLAVWRDGSRLRVIRIGPESPKSYIDAFALGFTRARVDAIVTSGANVRAEPEEGYELGGPGELPRGLAAWRRECAAPRTAPLPMVVVLTSGRRLDLDQPLFRTGAAGRRVCIYTGAEGAARLRSAAEQRGVEVLVAEETSLPDVLDRLRRQEGCRLVSVEAGPQASAPLYEPGSSGSPLLDELVLSVYEGADLAASAQGPAKWTVDDLDSGWPAIAPPRRVDEPSGPWCVSIRRPAVGGDRRHQRS